jgi:mono/diheme cytochrome c family protein
MPRRIAAHAVALLAAAGSVHAAAGDDSIAAGDARIANGWRVLRAVDCARCHGKDYAGLAAPSIVRYAATVDRATFMRTVLDGDPPRGMPGYRGNSYVVDNLDDIYRYFGARAAGAIAPDYRPANERR